SSKPSAARKSQIVNRQSKWSARRDLHSRSPGPKPGMLLLHHALETPGLGRSRRSGWNAGPKPWQRPRGEIEKLLDERWCPNEEDGDLMPWPSLPPHPSPRPPPLRGEGQRVRGETRNKRRAYITLSSSDSPRMKRSKFPRKWRINDFVSSS